MNRNCECGNHCYKIVGGEPGKFQVDWAHDPMQCPFGCEDCEEEAADRQPVAYGEDVE